MRLVFDFEGQHLIRAGPIHFKETSKHCSCSDGNDLLRKNTAASKNRSNFSAQLVENGSDQHGEIIALTLSRKKCIFLASFAACMGPVSPACRNYTHMENKHVGHDSKHAQNNMVSPFCFQRGAERCQHICMRSAQFDSQDCPNRRFLRQNNGTQAEGSVRGPGGISTGRTWVLLRHPMSLLCGILGLPSHDITSPEKRFGHPCSLDKLLCFHIDKVVRRMARGSKILIIAAPLQLKADHGTNEATSAAKHAMCERRTQSVLFSALHHIKAEPFAGSS